MDLAAISASSLTFLPCACSSCALTLALPIAPGRLSPRSRVRRVTFLESVENANEGAILVVSVDQFLILVVFAALGATEAVGDLDCVDAPTAFLE